MDLMVLPGIIYDITYCVRIDLFGDLRHTQKAKRSAEPLFYLPTLYISNLYHYRIDTLASYLNFFSLSEPEQVF